ncbi:MAG: LemA family protein [Bdellovibrionota bacterium]
MAFLFVFAFLGILVVVALFMGVGIYNSLVALSKQVDRSWSNIDVILKQRHDEVPQLVEIVQQYVTHEKNILDKVTEARTHYMNAKNTDEKVKASNEMTRALGGVLAIGEAYPELKSSNHFLQLQGRLTGLEEQLADRREHFNDTVTTYNTRIAQFPDMFFAGLLNYHSMELFKVSESDKSMPSLKVKI